MLVPTGVGSRTLHLQPETMWRPMEVGALLKLFRRKRRAKGLNAYNLWADNDA